MAVVVPVCRIGTLDEVQRVHDEPAAALTTDSVKIERVPLQYVQRHQFEHLCVRRFEHHVRRLACFPRFYPAQDVQAPPVARLEAAKAHFRPRRAEVVATGAGKLEKLFGDFDADEMGDACFATGGAAAVPEKAGQWSEAAGLQRSAQYVLLFRRRFGHED